MARSYQAARLSAGGAVWQSLRIVYGLPYCHTRSPRHECDSVGLYYATSPAHVNSGGGRVTTRREAFRWPQSWRVLATFCMASVPACVAEARHTHRRPCWRTLQWFVPRLEVLARDYGYGSVPFELIIAVAAFEFAALRKCSMLTSASFR